MKTEILKLTQVRLNDVNPRSITDDKFRQLVSSLLILPKMLTLRPVVVDNSLVALGGNMRMRALTHIAEMSDSELKERLSEIAGFQKKPEKEREALLKYWHVWKDSPTVPVMRASGLTDAEQREFVIKDNVGYGEWDYEALANEWDGTELEEWGLDVWNSKRGENKEVDIEDFDEKMDFKLKLTSQEFFELQEGLLEVKAREDVETNEQAIFKLLNSYEAKI